MLELRQFVEAAYGAEEYPGLISQARRWELARPLDGLRILDCTPLFRNTLTKFIPLLAAGAQVTVGLHPDTPSDDDIVSQLPELSLDFTTPDESGSRAYDVVLDCAGRHADVLSRFGYAELTHSGLAAYGSSRAPVVMVDRSHIKLIETMFGTGDSFFRAIKQLGFDKPSGPLLIFGAGKVGSGIALGAQRRGLQVALVDSPGAANFAKAPLIDVQDHDAVAEAIRSAWVVVTATGVASAADPFARELLTSGAVLANMGVDDEFGPDIPAGRVLNAKAPVNFCLDEPTLLKYMDPVFALSNESALDLVAGRVSPGVNAPSESAEDHIVSALANSGALSAELQSINKLNSN